MRLIRNIRRPSAAMLVACAALFSAVGGTSYAALKITGADIVNGSLTGVEFKKKSLQGNRLKKNTVDGSRVKESTLGTVPSAAHATAADTALNADKRPRRPTPTHSTGSTRPRSCRPRRACSRPTAAASTTSATARSSARSTRSRPVSTS